LANRTNPRKKNNETRFLQGDKFIKFIQRKGESAKQDGRGGGVGVGPIKNSYRAKEGKRCCREKKRKLNTFQRAKRLKTDQNKGDGPAAGKGGDSAVDTPEPLQSVREKIPDMIRGDKGIDRKTAAQRRSGRRSRKR